MKKLSFLFIALFLAIASHAQCVVDSNLAVLDSTTGGFYPDAAHIPHIVPDSAYSQTVQGKIAGSMSYSFTYMNIPIIATVSVDTVSLDSLAGLPTGITWTKSSDILLGGGIGCVQFSGLTTDTPGVYPISAYGFVKIHYSVEGGIEQGYDSSYGSLERLPAFSNFYLVVDTGATFLAATTNARTSCGSLTAGSATVTASGGSTVEPYTYLWNNGVTSYTVNNLAAGTYYVTVTSGIDTVMDSVIVIADPTPIAITTGTVTPDSNATQTDGQATISVSGGTPPYTYHWTNGDTTTTIDNLAPGTYFVTVRDSLGCASRDSVVVHNLSAGIASTVDITAQINLFPNPVSNQLNVVVESPVAINAQLEVIDMTGKVVYTTPANIPGARYTQVIDVSKLSQGVYVLQLSSEKQIAHQRFVVTHSK